jgi:hypothetical protein
MKGRNDESMACEPARHSSQHVLSTSHATHFEPEGPESRNLRQVNRNNRPASGGHLSVACPSRHAAGATVGRRSPLPRLRRGLSPLRGPLRGARQIFCLACGQALELVGCIFGAGCGPSFDPASLIASPRVLGARIEVAGAPERASPRPGETADLTWLVTSPEGTPPLHWAFAVCLPGNAALTCDGAPLALFEASDTPARTVDPEGDDVGAHAP